MQKSESVNELVSALVKAQAEIKHPVKNKVAKGAKFSYGYADLTEVIDAVKPALAKQGLCFIQSTQLTEQGTSYLETTLHHVSGQWISSRYPIPTALSPQEAGSYLTYFKRYMLSGLFGLAAEDDDDGERVLNKDSVKKIYVSRDSGGDPDLPF